MTEELAMVSFPERDFRERNRAEFGFPYKFSIVMAVYNVELFLREAIDSVLAQDIGFEENVQLILVDDGSSDSSGGICDEYKERFPENIMVIHKENGGVSSARNTGLKLAEGRYLNFMDSDDKLGINTMSEVYKFFTVHEKETDVVAIPMYFFDGATGPHLQNRKFQKGSRIINLLQEWQVFQLSCSSAFIRPEVAKEICFDCNLAYCEDGKEMLKLLLLKMTLGVVKTGIYWYRKRTLGFYSAIQSSKTNPQWYMPYLKGFVEETILNCQKSLGYIPKFIQSALMYDLQWRILQEHIPDGIMDDKEKYEYKSLLFSFFQYIEDDVIMSQQNIFVEHKAFVLRKKYGRKLDILWGYNDAILHYKNTCVCHLNTNKTYLDFIIFERNAISIEGYTVLIAEKHQDLKLYLEINGEETPCALTNRNLDRMSLDEPIYFGYSFQCTAPINPDIEEYAISLFCTIDGNRINRNKLFFGKFCPISNQYQNAYYYYQGYILSIKKEKLHIQKCGLRGRIQREYLFLKELWKKNRVGARKAVLVRSFYYILKKFVKKPIWLISDRIDKADDNGEALFQYMSKHKEINTYFSISPKSPHYKRIRKVGKVVPFLGWRYKILYLLSDAIISSQGEDYIFHPFQGQSELYRDLAQPQRFIFLQHGVSKDDLSDWLNRFNKNISIFVTATQPEYQSILAYNYYYCEREVKLTGFPRYDKLYHNEKKMITIMPTWRAYLVTELNPKTGKREIKADFQESQYFDMYDALLNNQKLFDSAQVLGYTIAFLSHPNMSSAITELHNDQRLKLLEKDTAYRDIFAQSDLIITDYSSVAFDFAYLRKPVLYYQKDKDEFFSGAHTYKKGYFDYEKNGFGEVEYSLDTLVERIIEYMKSGCELKDKYRERIDSTFPFSDQNNCQRVYDEIIKFKTRE